MFAEWLLGDIQDFLSIEVIFQVVIFMLIWHMYMKLECFAKCISVLLRQWTSFFDARIQEILLLKIEGSSVVEH